MKNLSTQIRIFGLAALAALLVTGCGGGDSNRANRFAGTYDGTYSQPEVTDGGPMSLTVDRRGNVTGTVHSDSFDADGAVSGKVRDNGRIEARIVAVTSGSPGRAIFAGFTGDLTGTVSLSGNGAFSGDLTLTDVAGSRTYTVALARETTP